MPDPLKESKHDALIGFFIATFFAIVVAANILCWFALGNQKIFDIQLGRMIIAIALAGGVATSILLSARIFWRNRINLGAWMLMFGINALGMMLATQLFKWIHPSVNDAVSKQSAADLQANGINALLLAVALMSALLVRGAALLKDAARMPAWMARRNKAGQATPRLWLFALFWITPIAWWGLILGVLYALKFKSDEMLLKVAIALCLAIITTRIAVRFVLFEKNKHTNWQRKLTGWPRIRQWATSAGMTLAGALTFYAYFYMAARVQEDALTAQLRIDQKILAELKEFKTEPLAPNDNAEVIYKLARNAVVPINWEWAKENWNTPEAELEVAKNLTALSYFRQGAARKGVDLGFDWTRSDFPSIQISSVREVGRIGLLEMRIAGAKDDWETALENFKSGLAYTRFNGEYPAEVPALVMCHQEAELIQAAFAMFVDTTSHPSDQSLMEAQKILRQHIDGRTNYLDRALYRGQLTYLVYVSEQRSKSRGLVGASDVPSMLDEHALLEWGGYSVSMAILPFIKLASRQNMNAAALKKLAEPIERHNAEQRLGRKILGFGMLNLRAVAKLRLLQTALGIKRYQRFYGRWPSRLADCIPQFMSAVPPDPYVEGEFIHYEPSPPRVCAANIQGQYNPGSHGFPNENRFKPLSMPMSNDKDRDLVLFLGN